MSNMPDKPFFINPEFQEIASKPVPDKPNPIIKKLIKEPFIHFILLGVVLFNISEYLEEKSNRPEIVISQSKIDAIADNYKLQYGQSPNPVQLKILIDNIIKEDVFYHEALKLNLDKEDEIIRRRLVQKFEFLQQDLSIFMTLATRIYWHSTNHIKKTTRFPVKYPLAISSSQQINVVWKGQKLLPILY